MTELRAPTQVPPPAARRALTSLPAARRALSSLPAARPVVAPFLLAALALVAPGQQGWLSAQAAPGSAPAAQEVETPASLGPPDVPAHPAPLRDLRAPPRSEMEPLVERFAEDRAVLLRFYDVESPWRRERLRALAEDWDGRLAAVPFDALDVEGRIDWILLRNQLEYARHVLERHDRWEEEIAPLLPFKSDLLALHRARRALEPVDPARAAETLHRLALEVEETRAAVRRGLEDREDGEVLQPTPVMARRAATRLSELRFTISSWFEHYDGYDPQFGWWVRAPFAALDEALEAYHETLRRDVIGISPDEPEPIIGDPIGREAVLQDLEHEMVPYTPEELLDLAERELAWGEARMREAAGELGFGDDWRAALEYVKGLHVPPGDQPQLVVELAREAEDFLARHDLVTVPPLAREIWRMTMLSPERQRIAPFFLGGEVVRVAYPTEEMTHEEKVMSMRGNNVHFSRAVVHHELIPGHHLQGFMTRRYSTHRQSFSTPFWGEGWALYWELLLWDLDFPRSPEDRIGMLFWRNHRAARILFSLGFHLGEMTPEECVELLIERVGHERASAEAEVRRSFAGDYPPLYQAAYLLGGLQLRALHRELVETGRMTNRDFHDRILRTGRIPIEMVRASLTEELLPPDHQASWRFYEPPENP